MEVNEERLIPLLLKFLKKETKNMARVRERGINTPYLLFIDYEERKIYMQYVTNSLKLRDYFFKLSAVKKSEGDSIAYMRGNVRRS